MKIHDKLEKIKGHLSLRVMNRQGEIINRFEWDNLIVNIGYQAAAEMLSSSTRITRIGIGTNDTAPASEDIALTNPLTFNITSVEYPETEFPGTVQFNFSIDFLQAVGMNIVEWGLLTNDGRLFSRIVRLPISKTNEMMLVGAWTINI